MEAEAIKCSEMDRTVITRFGIVLDKNGGALEEMIRFMKLGVATIVGDGKQSFSWVVLDDLVIVIEHLILNTDCEGPYNLTAPTPTTNLELTKDLASKINIHITFHIPKCIFKIEMGESSSLITSGQHVVPAKLIQSGFRFTIQEYITSLDK